LMGLGVLLTGCVTVSPVLLPVSTASAQKQLDNNFNTARDNTPVMWSTDNVAYGLTTHHTFVDQEGRPCRSYSLNINKSVFNNKTFTGTVCRYNNHWKNTPE